MYLVKEKNARLKTSRSLAPVQETASHAAELLDLAEIIERKDDEIASIGEQLEAARNEISRLEQRNRDLVKAKNTLAQKVYSNRCKETPRMFGPTISLCRLPRIVKSVDSSVAPTREFVTLPQGIRTGPLVELPQTIVQLDVIEVNDLRIRCTETLGGGGNGKVISGEFWHEGSDQKTQVAIKVIPTTHEFQELEMEVRALQMLGPMGIAPRFVAAIETTDRFLLVMVSMDWTLLRWAYLAFQGETRNVSLGFVQKARQVVSHPGIGGFHF